MIRPGGPGAYRPNPEAERTEELGPEHLGFRQIYHRIDPVARD